MQCLKCIAGFSKVKELFEEINKAKSGPYDSLNGKFANLIPDGYTYSLMREAYASVTGRESCEVQCICATSEGLRLSTRPAFFAHKCQLVLSCLGLIRGTTIVPHQLMSRCHTLFHSQVCLTRLEVTIYDTTTP